MNFTYPDGATPLDPDEKEGLKLSHITMREELNRWEQQNITEAYDWLQRTRNREILSESFLKVLHKKMFGKVWMWTGEFRLSNKNIGVDWPQVPMHTRNLLDDVRYWIEYETYPEDEIATRFHHRLVEIHLFPNGNGRHARMITDHLLEEEFKRAPFSWGSGNLINDWNVRTEYITSLREADKQNYNPLLEFVRS